MRSGGLLGLLLIGACQGAAPAPVESPQASESHTGVPATQRSAPPAPTPVEPTVLVGSVEFSPAELRSLLTFSPLPEPPDDPTNAYDTDPAAARLGQALFYDERLSGAGDTACVTCHDPGLGWADERQLPKAKGFIPRHTPSLWNTAYSRWFFWDGRKDTLWSQALQPLEDAREHGGSRLQYAHLVHGDPELRAAYEGIFGALPELSDGERFPPHGRPQPPESDVEKRARRGKPAPIDELSAAWYGMTPADQHAINGVFVHLGKALAAFQRQIVSRHAPFDEFVEGVRTADAGKQAALDDPARRGLKLFLGKARCHLCHAGPTFSDLEFHDNRLPPLEGGTSQDAGRFGGLRLVAEDPFNGLSEWSDERGEAIQAKLGYLRKRRHNYGEFKTATLRNVAVSPPYMHEGQFKDLDDVLQFYSTMQRATPAHHMSREKLLVPLQLTDGEITDLKAFLHSLTDTELDGSLLSAPASPLLR